VVNNLRDIDTDAAAGKRTLAVVIGKRRTQAEYGALLGIAYAVPVILAAAWVLGARPGGVPWAAGFAVALPLFTLTLARPLLRTVATFREPRELNLVLKGTARLSLVFGLLFAVGLAIGGWAGA
jgi:1,4-dihydroxy-2-naphthoate polyprenyltransferase